jgi:hypothetical protein
VEELLCLNTENRVLWRGKRAEKYVFSSGVGSVCLSFILELIRKGYEAVSFIFFPDKPLVE